MVFRRAGYAFPRARGRAGFELGANNVWVDRPIAPGDGNLRKEGRWELNATGDLCFHRPGQPGIVRSLRLIAVEPDRLMVEEKT